LNRGTLESSKRFTTALSRTTSLALLLNQNSNPVEVYLRKFGNEIESADFAIAASLRGGVDRIYPQDGHTSLWLQYRAVAGIGDAGLRDQRSRLQ